MCVAGARLKNRAILSNDPVSQAGWVQEHGTICLLFSFFSFSPWQLREVWDRCGGVGGENVGSGTGGEVMRWVDSSGYVRDPRLSVLRVGPAQLPKLMT